MANLGIIEIYGNEGWVDAEVKMAEKYEGFAFEAGKQYTLQVIGNNKMYHRRNNTGRRRGV